MPKVQETNDEIIFTENMSNGIRIFLTIVGLIPMFLAPYELLIRPSWNGFNLYLILPILISVGAIFVGGLFVAAGILGLNQTIIFLAKSKTIYYSYESALIHLRRKTYKFSDIAKSSINTHDWTDGPSTYSLQFIFKDGKKIETSSFKTKNEAEQSLNKVENLIR
jgi:hypothetical protein